MAHGQIFILSADFLQMTSCHCSSSLTCTKHHPCISSSCSRTSSLMFPLSFLQRSYSCSNSLDAIRREVSCLPTAPTNSGLPLFHLSYIPFKHDSLLFHVVAVEVILRTPTGTLSSVPSTFGSCSLTQCLHCEFKCFSVPTFECFLPIGSCNHADLHWCDCVNFLHLGCRMCLHLVYDVLQR